jgi:vitamin-K-epoxide reductase (warfarin-sensitive)
MVLIIALIGLGITLYGIMVEKKVQEDSQYKAACDISDKVSCTRTFTSPYAKMFGFSNIWALFFYYCTIIALYLCKAYYFVFLTAAAGCIVSIFFAYILYFKIRTLCLICTSLYIVNAVLLYAAYMLI